MAHYRITFCRRSMNVVEIEADSVREAKEKFEDNDFSESDVEEQEKEDEYEDCERLDEDDDDEAWDDEDEEDHSKWDS